MAGVLQRSTTVLDIERPYQRVTSASQATHCHYQQPPLLKQLQSFTNTTHQQVRAKAHKWRA
jgi:hypothetical protein